ncbi:tetratricopeptide repeat protein [Aquirufa sp. ROCK2-A2]
MTDNHFLLFRVAELMLEQEQHVLPVDMLFDDNQIGDFVKSIQIDSPFQQMLLEGVLTESVREEKLYVGFTVEGYFHYILGEVIFKQTEGCGAEVLKQMVEGNKLNGLKEGIEQCLIRDVNQNDLSRLMWLIDSGGDLLDLCAKPLAHSFLNIKGQINSEEELTKAYSDQISRVTNELFADPTDNDTEALSRAINYLEETQKNNVLALVYHQINELIVPTDLKKAIIYVKSIEYIPEYDRINKLQSLEDYQLNEESDLASTFYNSLGQQFYFVGNYEKAIDFYKKSLHINIALHGEVHSSTGLTYNNFGLIMFDQYEFDKAFEFYEKSLSIRLKFHGNHHPSIGQTYNNLGTVCGEKGEYDKAIDYFEKSLAIRVKIHGNQHTLSVNTYNNLGAAWSDKGQFEKAFKYLKKALSTYIIVHGDHHPRTANAYNNLGSAFERKGDYDSALENFEKSLHIRLNVLGNQHSTTGESYNSLGSAFRGKGDYDSALENFEKSLNIRLNVHGDQHPSVWSAYNDLGLSWFKKGDIKKAIEYFEKSLAGQVNTHSEKNQSIASTYTYLGDVFKDEIDLLKAEEYYLKAYGIFIKSLGSEHPNTKFLEQKLYDL